jgi:hypothetical protein
MFAPEAQSNAFIAEVTDDDQSWTSNRFNIVQGYNPRLQKILDDLEIKEGPDNKGIMNALRRSVYQKQVKVPGVEFWDLNTWSGGWVIALLSTALLVALKNALRQIPDGSDGGINEPWLVVDATSPIERLVSAFWKFSMVGSGWLATFGVILSTEGNYLATGGSWLAIDGLYLFFVLLLTINTWTALEILGDLRRVRELRGAFGEPPVDELQT